MNIIGTIAIAALLSLSSGAFAQDTKGGTTAATPGRGAGDMGTGAPASGPRSNATSVDTTAGRSAAPAPTVGAPKETPNAAVPTNR